MTGWDLFCAAHFAGEITVLGPKCEQSECIDLVTALVHWPSGPVRCCERHTARWREVARVMGVHLVVEPIFYQRGGLDDAEQRFAAMELT